MDIEAFRAENTPQMQRYGEALESGIVRGNMGSLVVIKLGAGAELAEHAHEEEQELRARRSTEGRRRRSFAPPWR